MKKSLLKLLLDRDKYCWHCGETDTLVPHHRKNRGMGGRKSLDVPNNLILVCSEYNYLMEADSKILIQATVWGHKLRQTDSLFELVFDNVLNQWFELNNEGKKYAVTDKRSSQF